jgi:alkylation response protein AidB-like acyl-CoA dehydrogenase
MTSANDDRVGTLLTDDLLERIRSRAADHDRANTFPHDDLADLAEAGYLTAFVPAELGGGGLTLEQLCEEQSRLAAAGPATALAINMHHVWVGVARQVRAAGEDSMDEILARVMEGAILAFGVSERGNDLVLFGSASQAVPDDDGAGYSFDGTKIFTSLGPVWTLLGTFGTDRSDPDDPVNVWGFVERDDPGVEIVEDWDTLGMRATQSYTTILRGAHAPARRIVRTVAPGPQPDPFLFGIFSSFEILLSAVYRGIARRALELAIGTVKKRRSLKNDAPYSSDPDIRWRIADAAIELDALDPQISVLARDVDAGASRDLWLPQLSAVKSRATETALRVVEKAVRVSGGGSYYSSSELSRLYRDVLAGLFHPSDDESVHGAWAGALLGPVPKADA